MDRFDWVRLVKRGVGRGAMAGIGLAGGYIGLAIPLFGLLLVVSNATGGKVGEALIGAGVFAMCAWPFGIVLGMLPGALVGAGGGLVIGGMAAMLGRRIGRGGMALVGFGVGAVLALLAHLLLAPGLVNDNATGIWGMLPYLFWIGGPSMVMPGGLTWVGWTILDFNQEAISFYEKLGYKTTMRRMRKEDEE